MKVDVEEFVDLDPGVGMGPAHELGAEQGDPDVAHEEGRSLRTPSVITLVTVGELPVHLVRSRARSCSARRTRPAQLFAVSLCDRPEFPMPMQPRVLPSLCPPRCGLSSSQRSELVACDSGEHEQPGDILKLFPALVLVPKRRDFR